MGAKDPRELRRERMERVTDAVALRVPDRVPLIPQFEAFPMYYSGLTIRDAMNDYRKVAGALDRCYADFQPDLGWGPGLMHSAPALEACGIVWFRWPGHGIEEPDQMYQFIEGEYMLPHEYDELVHDPTHFIQSKWIPRCFTKLGGFRHLRLRSSLWAQFTGSFSAFANQEVIQSLEAMLDTAKKLTAWGAFAAEYEKKMEEEMGFPPAAGGSAFAPFDLLGDTLRGTEGLMMDILERPEKVLRAVEALLPLALEVPIDSCRVSGRKLVWIWLHKGTDEFMSPEQYATFYWPTLRKLIEGLVDAGLTPVVYAEGRYNTRLETLREVPKAKVVYDFETVDMFRAKDILGDVACIAGNLPNAMLFSGSPDEVDLYCKGLIQGVGKNGGFMLDAGGLIDNARPENLRAMFDSVEKYGRR